MLSTVFTQIVPHAQTLAAATSHTETMLSTASCCRSSRMRRNARSSRTSAEVCLAGPCGGSTSGGRSRTARGGRPQPGRDPRDPRAPPRAADGPCGGSETAIAIGGWPSTMPRPPGRPTARWPPAPRKTGLPLRLQAPVRPVAVSTPAKPDSGLQEHPRDLPTGPVPGEPDSEDPISASESGALDLSSVDNELLAEHRALRQKIGPRAGGRTDGRDDDSEGSKHWGVVASADRIVNGHAADGVFAEHGTSPSAPVSWIRAPASSATRERGRSIDHLPGALQ